ncbi:MAG TPA: 5-bromo-4-chloroindolyl phosphate hydrolysis family protein [Candidatus Blautia faecavium]|uniref:5-bromo-4-chloroindolyl phosphate hydrolysis family protein n=1 Tax=Candidatus Blautia faecavium TaxID=2838487 RepID=A0A9D2LVN4_9FIRM|nr:5-bromo-4-chloroindolyl phosphate hydrolysis family protein [Candidatus Blautia faecavium]
MERWEWEELGGKVQDIIESAVNSKDYKKLSQSVGEVLERTLGQYRSFSDREKSRKDSAWEVRQEEKKQTVFSENLPELYGQLTGEKVKRILQTVFGGILTGSMGIGLFVVLILEIFLRKSIFSLLGPAVFLALGTLAGVVLLAMGCSGIGSLSRFKRYKKTLGKNTYCELQALSRAVGRTVKFIKKDIRRMIAKGWFLEGHLDEQETCLITSNETYSQYLETQRQLEQRKKQGELERQQREAQEKTKEKIPEEIQEVLDKGNDFIEKIHASNDAIPGEEISEKISKMELIVRQIFKRAEEHPEIVPDLKRMMDYYLPMTIKLLDAYEEMDGQPVQGENIRNSKKEIEDTIDTLNEAFAKLLDSVFKDTAWDVSSDISVLHTMLAQEGLTKGDFTL